MFSPSDVVLNPGDFHFTSGAARIRTLLGSCVSITIWHPALRIGGMCHYMLPTRRLRDTTHSGHDGRYADEAVQLFLREVRRHGTHPAEYEVKMFGGGSQFRQEPAASAIDIPGENIAVGLRLLTESGF